MADKIEYARLPKAQGKSLGVIAAKTDIPKSHIHPLHKFHIS